MIPEQRLEMAEEIHPYRYLQVESAGIFRWNEKQMLWGGACEEQLGGPIWLKQSGQGANGTEWSRCNRVLEGTGSHCSAVHCKDSSFYSQPGNHLLRRGRLRRAGLREWRSGMWFWMCYTWEQDAEEQVRLSGERYMRDM